MNRILASLAVTVGLGGCVLLPSSFSLGVRSPNRAKIDGVFAALTWNLQPRHVVNEDYVTFDEAQEGGDIP